MTHERTYNAKFIAGLVIGLCVVSGLFAVASAAASNLGGSYALGESASHKRNLEFANSWSTKPWTEKSP